MGILLDNLDAVQQRINEIKHAKKLLEDYDDERFIPFIVRLRQRLEWLELVERAIRRDNEATQLEQDFANQALQAEDHANSSEPVDVDLLLLFIVKASASA